MKTILLVLHGAVQTKCDFDDDTSKERIIKNDMYDVDSFDSIEINTYFVIVSIGNNNEDKAVLLVEDGSNAEDISFKTTIEGRVLKIKANSKWCKDTILDLKINVKSIDIESDGSVAIRNKIKCNSLIINIDFGKIIIDESTNIKDISINSTSGDIILPDKLKKSIVL